MRCSNKWILVTVSLAFVACGKSGKKSDDSSVAATEVSDPILTSADLTAPANQENETSITNVVKEISSDAIFYDKKPEGTDATDSCMKGRYNFAKIHASGSKMKFGYKVDATDCLGATTNTDNLKVSGAIVSLYFEITCSGSDLSSLDGKSVDDTESLNTDLALCKTGGTVLAQTSLTAHFDATGTDGSANVDFTITSSQSKDGVACSLTVAADGTTTTEEGCKKVNKTTYGKYLVNGKATDQPSSYSVYTSKGITDKAGDTIWNDSGSVDVLYLGWKGTVTFQSGTVAPTYSLTAPGGQSAKTGSLTVYDPNAKLALSQVISKAVNIDLMKFKPGNF